MSYGRSEPTSGIPVGGGGMAERFRKAVREASRRAEENRDGHTHTAPAAGMDAPKAAAPVTPLKMASI